MPTLDTDRLQTIKNYAAGRISPRTGKAVSVAYVYQLLKKGKLEGLIVDGVQFVVLPPKP